VLQFGLQPVFCLLPAKRAAAPERCGSFRSPFAVKTNLSRIVLALALIWVVGSLVPRGNSGSFDLADFGRLPVLADVGSSPSIPSLARDSPPAGAPAGRHPRRPATRPEAWLLDVFFRPEAADTYAMFASTIRRPFHFQPHAGRRRQWVDFPFASCRPALPSSIAGPLGGSNRKRRRSAFQRAVIELREHSNTMTA